MSKATDQQLRNEWLRRHEIRLLAQLRRGKQ